MAKKQTNTSVIAVYKDKHTETFETIEEASEKTGLAVNSIKANIGIAIATESSENFPVQIGKKYNIKKTGESNILDNVNLFDNFMLYKYPK